MKTSLKKPESMYIRGVCVLCNVSPQAGRGKRKGRQLYAAACSSCRNKHYGQTVCRFKKARCKECGFVAKHPCQLDVDHIDGNNSNNSLDNLQTLCSNCHRLKTWLNRDWETRS